MRFSPRTPARAAAEPALRRTPGRDRVREVDVLRGFALLGILMVNALSMAGPYAGQWFGPVGSRVDDVAGWLVTALVSAKFYLLFSFLFGYSFTLQRASAERAGAAFAPRHLRRLVCLFLLGLAHGVLLFPGDVLMVYAVLSLPLFACRDLASRTAIRAAVRLVAATVACLLAWGLLTVAYADLVPVPPHEVTAAVEEAAATRQGDLGSVVGDNLRRLRDSLGWNIVYAADILGAFLVGLVAGRRGLLAEPGRHRARLVPVVLCCLPLGLAGGVFMAVCRNGPLDPRWFHVGSAVGVLTAPALTAAYVCGMLLLLRTRPGRRVGDALAPAGRMALTNYLTQSLVMALVLTGYGLAWYGRFGTAVVLGGCLVLYAVQLTVSGWLMRRFRYGPVEWLLRTATLGRRP